MRILAFPYAYGSANIYFDIINDISNRHPMTAFDYPGHGTRLDEDAVSSISALVDDAYKNIVSYINEPYCLLGYSMGGIIVFELCQKLIREGKKMPEHIFLLATREPDWMYEKDDYEKYDIEDVKALLRRKNGTDEEILAIDELMELIAPSVKADSIALRDYKADAGNCFTLRCGVTIIRGSNEDRIDQCQQNWEKYIKHPTDYLTVEGDHFFLFNNNEKNSPMIRDIICDRLRAYS